MFSAGINRAKNTSGNDLIIAQSMQNSSHLRKPLIKTLKKWRNRERVEVWSGYLSSRQGRAQYKPHCSDRNSKHPRPKTHIYSYQNICNLISSRNPGSPTPKVWFPRCSSTKDSAHLDLLDFCKPPPRIRDRIPRVWHIQDSSPYVTASPDRALLS
jgi:hypothetical protein